MKTTALVKRATNPALAVDYGEDGTIGVGRAATSRTQRGEAGNATIAE